MWLEVQILLNRIYVTKDKYSLFISEKQKVFVLVFYKGKVSLKIDIILKY